MLEREEVDTAMLCKVSASTVGDAVGALSRCLSCIHFIVIKQASTVNPRLSEP